MAWEMACFFKNIVSRDLLWVLTWNFGHLGFWGRWLRIWDKSYKIQNVRFNMTEIIKIIKKKRLIYGKFSIWGFLGSLITSRVRFWKFFNLDSYLVMLILLACLKFFILNFNKKYINYIGYWSKKIKIKRKSTV